MKFLFPSVVVNILSFSGGGSHGAIELGILKSIYQGEQYKQFLGVSAGSLNAAIMSSYKEPLSGIEKLNDIYTNTRNSDIYKLNFSLHTSLLDSQPLLETIKKHLPSTLFYPCSVGVTNLDSGQFEIVELNKNDNKANVLLASSSIPVVFPPTKLGSTYYVDGGLINNQILNNLYDGYYLNVTYITPSFSISSWNESDINIISLALRDFEVYRKTHTNTLLSLYKNCFKPIGEIHVYYTDEPIPYSVLEFNHGSELIKFGEKNVRHSVFNLCIVTTKN